MQRQLSWWQKPLFAFAGSPAGAWFFMNIAPRVDRFLLPVSRGRWSSGLGQPVGILKIKGAKSGRIRETVLLCTPHEGNFIVVASRGGNAKHPAWYYNLRANPDIRLFINGREEAYRAYETSGSEREALWQKAVWFYPGYASYQARAGARTIPVFLLKPAQNERVASQ